MGNQAAFWRRTLSAARSLLDVCSYTPASRTSRLPRSASNLQLGSLLLCNLVVVISSLVVLNCGGQTPPEVRQGVSKESSDSVNELKARIDDLNNRIYVLTEQVESLKATRTATFSTASAPKMTKASKKNAGVTISATIPDNKNNASVQEQEYSAAYELFKSGQYAKALIAFSAFVGKNPASALTDNSIYWMGESYYRQKEYALAIEEYSKVLKQFPKESKAPYAMYKIALCYKMLGETKDADTYFNELLSRYPNSNAAKEAKSNAELKK